MTQAADCVSASCRLCRQSFRTVLTETGGRNFCFKKVMRSILCIILAVSHTRQAFISSTSTALATAHAPSTMAAPATVMLITLTVICKLTQTTELLWSVGQRCNGGLCHSRSRVLSAYLSRSKVAGASKAPLSFCHKRLHTSSAQSVFLHIIMAYSCMLRRSDHTGSPYSITVVSHDRIKGQEHFSLNRCLLSCP